MSTKKRYERPRVLSKTKYSDADLIAHACADLEVDIRCAERDGLLEYASSCRAKLALMRSASSASQIDSILKGPP